MDKNKCRLLKQLNAKKSLLANDIRELLPRLSDDELYLLLTDCYKSNLIRANIIYNSADMSTQNKMVVNRINNCRPTDIYFVDIAFSQKGKDELENFKRSIKDITTAKTQSWIAILISAVAAIFTIFKK